MEKEEGVAGRLTLEEFRKYKSIEECSDEEAMNTIDTLHELSIICWMAYQQQLEEERVRVHDFRAVSQAGYVAMCLELNERFDVVYLDQSILKKIYEPSKTISKNKVYSYATINRIRPFIIKAIAGAIAEHKYFGKYDPEWNATSIEAMKKSIEHLDPKDGKKIVDRCSAEIGKLFFEPSEMKNMNWRWNALLAIARVLVADGKIAYDRAREMYADPAKISRRKR